MSFGLVLQQTMSKLHVNRIMVHTLFLNLLDLWAKEGYINLRDKTISALEFLQTAI